MQRRCLLLWIFLLLAGCSTDLSDAGCTTDQACRGGRVCMGQQCVSPETPDASLDSAQDAVSSLDVSDGQDCRIDGLADACGPDTHSFDDVAGYECPAACTGGCDDSGCHIDGTASEGQLQCPDGMPCTVHCDGGADCPSTITCGDGACTVLCGGTGNGGMCTGETIDCGNAQICKVLCVGGSSCESEIFCRSSDCTVECSGGAACTKPIHCGTGSCDLTCESTANCMGGYTCGSADSCKCTGHGCDS